MSSAEGSNSDLNAVVSEIAGIVDSSLGTVEAYERVAEELRRAVPFDRLVVWAWQ